jgi:hypothetical protein
LVLPNDADRAQANVTIQNCVFNYSVGYGTGVDFAWIKVMAADVTIDYCVFYGVHGNTDDIDLTTGASNCTISNTKIYDGFYGIDVLAGTGHEFHDCTVQDASEWNILCENDSAGTIYNVIVIDGDYGGIKTGPTGDSTCSWTIHHTKVYRTAGTLRYGFNADDGDVNWYHCIAFNLDNGGGFVTQSAGVINAENNIAMNCGDYGYQATVACTGTRDYNCAFGNDTDYDAVNWIQGAHDVVDDPSFVSAPANFQLNVGSPCIDAGVAIAGINDGYVGVAPDIGRYEVAAAPASSKQSSMIQRLLVIR